MKYDITFCVLSLPIHVCNKKNENFAFCNHTGNTMRVVHEEVKRRIESIVEVFQALTERITERFDEATGGCVSKILDLCLVQPAHPLKIWTGTKLKPV